MPVSRQYGFIGLGVMGSAMVENLLMHCEHVTVHDLDPAAVERATGHGARAASSAAEVAEASEVVSICVPAASHVEAVMTGPNGILTTSCAGLTVLIHSTVLPATVVWARDVAAGHGVTVADACVAGGVPNARAGTQLVLAGGREHLGDAAKELIDIYAESIFDAGPVGAGAALKIAFNVMTYAQFAAAATSYDLVTAAGGEPNALFDAWRAAGQLGTLTDRYSALLGIPAEALVGPLHDLVSSQLDIARKDLSLALDLGPTRDGTKQVLEALRDAMPGVYGLPDSTD